MSEQEQTNAKLSQQIESLQQQWVAMQETILHIQRDMEQMHEALLSQTGDIDGLRAKMKELDGNIEQIMTSENFPSPEEDRPPHY